MGQKLKIEVLVRRLLHKFKCKVIVEYDGNYQKRQKGMMIEWG